jgi:hypothetical protein
MSALLFIAAVIWGSLSAQFLVQTLLCLINGAISLSALIFSKVSKLLNATGSLVNVAMALLFLALFLGGNWIASDYIDYESWNTNSIASVVASLATLVYCGVQVPVKILLGSNVCMGALFHASLQCPPAR